MLDLIIALIAGSGLALAAIICLSLWKKLNLTKCEYVSLVKTHTRTRDMLRAERLQYQRNLEMMSSRLLSKTSSVNIRLIYPSRTQVWEIWPDGYLKVCYFGTLSQAHKHIEACRMTGVNTILLHSKYLTRSPQEEQSSSSSELLQEDISEELKEVETGSSKPHTHPPDLPYEDGHHFLGPAYSPIPTDSSEKLTETLSIGNYPKDVEEIRKE